MDTCEMVPSLNCRPLTKHKEYVMTCETYHDIIAAHVDGYLTFAERHEVEEHLASCKNCSQLFTDQQRFRQISRTWKWEAPIPADVEHRLRAAIAAESSPLQSWWQKARDQLVSLLRPPQVTFVLGATTVLLLMLVLPKDQGSLKSQTHRSEPSKQTEPPILDAAAAYY